MSYTELQLFPFQTCSSCCFTPHLRQRQFHSFRLRLQPWTSRGPLLLSHPTSAPFASPMDSLWIYPWSDPFSISSLLHCTVVFFLFNALMTQYRGPGWWLVYSFLKQLVNPHPNHFPYWVLALNPYLLVLITPESGTQQPTTAVMPQPPSPSSSN